MRYFRLVSYLFVFVVFLVAQVTFAYNNFSDFSEEAEEDANYFSYNTNNNNSNSNSNSKNKNTANSKFELAIRNIKLGNTYREAKNYSAAINYTDKGLKVVERSRDFNGMYWTAVAYEHLGYIYRDMNQHEKASINLHKALDFYQRIIKQEDGSAYATSKVLEVLENINSICGDISSNNSTSNSKNSNNIINYGFISVVAGLDDADIITENIEKENIEKEKNMPCLACSSSGAVLNISNSKSKNVIIPANTTNLIARNNKYSEMPSLVFSCKNMKYLDLSHNKISEVSAMLPALSHLHYLNLSNNKIKRIPENISDLKELTELNLENNKLKELPSSLASMKHLQILNLRGNNISFEKIANIIRGLPNTNIIFDKYELVREEDEVAYDQLQP